MAGGPEHWVPGATGLLPRSGVRYARVGEEAVAYETAGTGDVDLLLLRPPIVGIDAVWDDPDCAYAHRRLASSCRLIQLDVRGTGSSDAYGVPVRPTLEAFVDDALAVLDAVGSERVALLGYGDFALVAVLLAATHPDRVQSLVLVNGYARFFRDRDYPYGHEPTPGVADVVMSAFFDSTSDFGCPSAALRPGFLEWYARARRQLLGPGSARRLYEATVGRDVRPVVRALAVPTLVVSRGPGGYTSNENSRWLAEHIAGARLVELGGPDFVYFSGDVDPLVDAVVEFATQQVPSSRHETRQLATVLFTDVVDSTGTAVRLGDAAWREVLDAHDELARECLRRWRGVLVASTGDGLLATFDGPARAVRCARELQRRARELGIGVRAGLHTGEVERRGHDIAGIGVHIAARVMGLAGEDEVLVSRTVVDLVTGSGLVFEDLGPRSLRGLDEPWSLAAVVEDRAPHGPT